MTIESKEKFTPGPWTLKHISGSNFAVQQFEIRGVFAGNPHVNPIFNKNTSAIDGTTIFVSPEDAYLISAAPEMYEMLIATLNMVEGDGRPPNWDMIREVLKKARGEK
jgi:hypothetical protein